MSGPVCTFPGCGLPGVIARATRDGGTEYVCEPCAQALTNMNRDLNEPGGPERVTRFLRKHGVWPGVRGSVDDA